MDLGAKFLLKRLQFLSRRNGDAENLCGHPQPRGAIELGEVGVDWEDQC
jgi:hypothetical protein